MPSESGSVSHSVMSDSFVTPWTVASQAPLSMEFFRQEYQSGQPFPSPGDPPGKPHHLPRVVTLWRIHRHTHKQKCARGAFPGGPVAKTACSRCGGLGSVPGQGARSHSTTESSSAAAKGPACCKEEQRCCVPS